ncbi:MAG: hypothetical protein ABIO55_13650 [Ginsengibacter sp.]
MLGQAFYSLKISFQPSIETFNAITTVLNVEVPLDNKFEKIPSIWEFTKTVSPEDNYFDFINNFLDILENKYDQLKNIGINRDDISIWFLYEYDQQCNMEFNPQRMKRLGENQITLCISCYEADDFITF